jgi:hypothetical protein
MLSFVLILAIGVGMGSLAFLGFVRKKGRKNVSFATPADARAYRNSIDTQAVRNAYAATRPY